MVLPPWLSPPASASLGVAAAIQEEDSGNPIHKSFQQNVNYTKWGGLYYTFFTEGLRPEFISLQELCRAEWVQVVQILDDLGYWWNGYADEDYQNSNCASFPHSDQAGFQVVARYRAEPNATPFVPPGPDVDAFYLRSASFPSNIQYPGDSHKRGYVCGEYRTTGPFLNTADKIWWACSTHLQGKAGGEAYTAGQAEFLYSFATSQLHQFPDYIGGDFNRTPTQDGMYDWMNANTFFEVDENGGPKKTNPNPGATKKYDYIFSNKSKANVGSGVATVDCFTGSDHCIVEGYHQAK